MQTVNQNVEEKGEDLFRKLLYRFAPYWPLFLILILMGGIGGWLYLKQATPMYDARATILIKDEKRGVDEAKMLEALDVYTSKKIVENEIEILKSRTLMTKVVRRLNLYATVYEEGRFRDGNLYKTSPIFVRVKDPQKIKPTGFYFTFNKKNGTVYIDNKAYAVNTWHKTPYGVLRFGINPKAYPVSDRPHYVVLSNPSNLAAGLIYGLTIKPTNKISTVLNLSFRDESSQRAKDVLNALIEEYAKGNINEKNALAANTLTFIEDRLNFLVKDLDSIEHTIQQYKSTQGIINLSEQGKQFLQNVGDNDRQMGGINMQLTVLDQIEKYVISKEGKGGMVPATLGLTDGALIRLLQRLYDSELQYEKLKQTMGENSPGVVAVANEIESIRPAILENVRNQKQNLRAALSDIASTNGQYASIIKTIPQKERKLLEISREQSIKNSVYTFLLQKREETALSSSSTVADSRLIDAAISSPLPASPSNLDVFFGAFLIAILTGIIIVIGKELFSGKILFRSDIEKYTKLPIAAEIASGKFKSELVINYTDKAFISEQFRQLRASIGLYGKVVSRKKLLITSSIAGEGKSFIASNLALSLSLSRKRIVLIDADFRRPKTSAIFNMDEEEGLTEYLKGEIDVKDLARETNYNNLFIVPAGGVCKNPTELLLNGNLNELFDYLGSQFDYVLVDTSPIAPVTDAYVLTEYCDKTLFVIRHGYTPMSMVKMLDENSKVKALNNLVIVFNGVKKRGFIKGSYGFGYGFGYEYAYKDRKDIRKKIKK